MRVSSSRHLPRISRPRLHIAAAFHRFQHGDFVGVLDVAADGNPHGDSGHLHADPLELLREIDGRRFPFHCGIGGKDHLVYVPRIHTRDEIGDAELLRADPMQRRNGSVEDVEDSIEMFRLVDRGDVSGLFYNTDQALVSRRTGAIYARIDVGDVVADRAEAETGFDVSDRGGERFGVFVAGAKDVKREALRALGSDARELFELIDQARHGFGEFGHGN